MGQKKLQRFAEIRTFPNVFEYPPDKKGKWHEYFQNTNPITLELACGKGEYAVGLGRLFPERNFLGVDLKGNRIWVGAKKALTEGLGNVAFVRSHIDKITQYFEKGEVSEIWITFPDPQLRTSRAKKRLTHPAYLRLYQQIMAGNGSIHLKTDSPALFEFTKLIIGYYNLELLAEDDNVYAGEQVREDLRIRTHYEGLDIAQSSRVHYLQFRLPAEPLPDRDKELKALIVEQENE